MKLANTNAVGSRLTCSGETKDETPESLKEDLLLCTLNIECLISNKITGDVDVLLELPSSFQTMLWEVQPNKTWNHLQTYINHTLTPGTGVTSSLLFAGTKSNPTTLNFGLLRSMLEDETESKKVGLKGGREEGVQLTWAGTKPVESGTGPTGAAHYVSFRFDVSSFVLDARALDLKDMTTLFSSVLTLLLSIMAFMHVSKMFFERWIDVWLTWYAETHEGYTLPEDVQRRQRVLEEHLVTGVPGSRQRRMSSMHNILENNTENDTLNDGNVGGGGGMDGLRAPKKQRRLSSREVIRRMHTNPMVTKSEASTSIEMPPMTSAAAAASTSSSGKTVPKKKRRLSSRELIQSTVASSGASTSIMPSMMTATVSSNMTNSGGNEQVMRLLADMREQMHEQMELDKQEKQEMREQMHEQMELDKQEMREQMELQKQEIDVLRARLDSSLSGNDETQIEIR